MAELKPCPFCGAELKRRGMKLNWGEHPLEKCPLSGTNFSPSQLWDWNRRALGGKLEALIEEYRHHAEPPAGYTFEDGTGGQGQPNGETWAIYCAAYTMNQLLEQLKALVAPSDDSGVLSKDEAEVREEWPGGAYDEE